jgi:2-polyprenyl-6-methoxyphenol hydroxylase-like FAD-dependent oxidoreductase
MELGGVVERGVAAASVEERDDGVLVRLERVDGAVEAVEAAWVIGAGGAHGVTRASMAEAMEGFTYPGRALAADVRVRCGLPATAQTWSPPPRATCCSRRHPTSAGSPSWATSTTARPSAWRAPHRARQ